MFADTRTSDQFDSGDHDTGYFGESCRNVAVVNNTANQIVAGVNDTDEEPNHSNIYLSF